MTPPLVISTPQQPFPMTGNATVGGLGILQSKIPLGDPEKLWAAARAFFDARDVLDAMTSALYGGLNNLFTNNASEDLDALDQFWNRIGGITNQQAILTALRESCDQLGRALSDFASWIFEAQNAIVQAIGNILEDILIGILLGLALAAISGGLGGLGEVVAIANGAGKAAEIVLAVDGVLTAVNVSGRLAAIGGAVGGVVGVMNVAIENTPSPNLGTGSEPKVTDEQITTEAQTTTGRAARAQELPELKYPEAQLQKKFKHADEFGVEGNWNSTAAQEYQKALEDFAKDPANTLKRGTYHGEPATLIYNETSGLCEVLRPDGTYWTGWRLGAEQMRHVVERGVLGGGG